MILLRKATWLIFLAFIQYVPEIKRNFLLTLLLGIPWYGLIKLWELFHMQVLFSSIHHPVLYYIKEIEKSSGCYKTDSIKIEVFPLPNPKIRGAGLVCANSKESYSVIRNKGATYSWNITGGTLISGIDSDSINLQWTTKSGIITVSETNATGCVFSDTFNVVVDSACVWPGDANYDKVVDASDVLNIALGYGVNGAARPNATIIWNGQPCMSWKDTFSNGINYKQADCNGDSTIDFNDTLAITANYSRTHLKTLSRTQGNPTDAPLQIVLNKDSAQVGDSITADVYLGTSTSNIKNIYGLCFGMNFNSALIDTNSICIDYAPNWFASYGTNQLHFNMNLFGSDRMDFAMSRIDHTGTSGYGKICSIKMKVSNAVPKTGAKLNFTFSNNKQIDAGGKYIPVYMSDDSMIVKQLLTGVKNTIPSVSSLNVYPNPFKGFTNIEYSLSRNEKVLVEVFDMTGRRISLLANEEQVSGTHNLKFESNGSAGQYILRIQTGDQVVYKQIVGLK